MPRKDWRSTENELEIDGFWTNLDKVRSQARSRERTGIFAKSPDSIVFGPDSLFSPEAKLIKELPSDLCNQYYLAPYRRADFPDWNWYE